MTATIPTTISEALVASIKQGQDLATRGIDAWTDLASKAPSSPSLDKVPFVEMLPTPTQVVDSGFAVVDVVVATQKELAQKLLDVVDAKSS
jgi:hypothetical protein